MRSGHWPTLLAAFLYFDVSFMIWTMLGPLGVQVGQSLGLSQSEKGLMVATPILAGAVLRIVLGFGVDKLGAKTVGIIAQLVVMSALAAVWMFGLKSFASVLLFGSMLGFAGASFAVALPQAGRWYPPGMQGLVLGLAGAGNIGVVMDSLLAPRLAAAYGWQNVFGIAVLPALLVFFIYAWVSKEAPNSPPPRTTKDYVNLLREPDTHWFCFYYTVSFGGFVGLASSLVLFFVNEFHMSPVKAGDYAALCTLIGAVARPFGGAVADRIGGTRALHIFFFGASLALAAAAFRPSLFVVTALFLCAGACFGMANGAVFQLLPQRFGKEMGIMTGLVGCGGGVGGFLLAASLGWCKQATGNYTLGLAGFALLVLGAKLALHMVKGRWRSTWGSLAEARI